MQATQFYLLAFYTARNTNVLLLQRKKCCYASEHICGHFRYQDHRQSVKQPQTKTQSWNSSDQLLRAGAVLPRGGTPKSAARTPPPHTVPVSCCGKDVGTAVRELRAARRKQKLPTKASEDSRSPACRRLTNSGGDRTASQQRSGRAPPAPSVQYLAGGRKSPCCAGRDEKRPADTERETEMALRPLTPDLSESSGHPTPQPDGPPRTASPHRARRALPALPSPPSPPPPAAGPVPWRGSSRRSAAGGDRAALTSARSEECDRGPARCLPLPQPTYLLAASSPESRPG